MDADPARAGRDAWVDRLLVEAGLPELATVLSTGSFTSAVAAVSAVTVLAFSYTRYGLVARPGSLPAAGHLAGFAGGATFLYLSCTGFVLLLTPTGSLPSPRWRWWARVQVAAAAVAFVTASLNPVPLYPSIRTSATRWASPPWPTGR